MQSVSQDWKDNQNNILTSEGFVEISFKMIDPDAHGDASVTDTGHVYFANTDNVISDVGNDISPYATFEKNQWLLDGQRTIVPDSGYNGAAFVSDVQSKSDGMFQYGELALDIRFSKVQTNMVQGVSIKWSEFLNEYATEFRVEAYDANDVLITGYSSSDNDSVLSVAELPGLVNYKRITVNIEKWSLPYRRARVDELTIGLHRIYTKTDILSYGHSQTVDPLSASLPKADISFSIDNLDNSYNPQNTGGLSKYLMERQPVTVRYGYTTSAGSKEWIKGGTYYLSEWDAPQNGMSANFKARDLLEFMRGTYYFGKYNPNGTSLYDLATSVLEDADLPLHSNGNNKWIIDESLKDIYTVAPLPIDTHANCLQMIANAGECIIYQDRDGLLRIEPIIVTDGSDYTISKFNSYTKPEVTLSKPLKQVVVPFNRHIPAEELSYMFEGTITVNGTQDVLIKYSCMATDVVAYIISGGILNSSHFYSNACVLNITGTGVVSLQVYGHALNVASVNVVTPSSDVGDTITVENPLITDSDRAKSVGIWAESYLKNRMVFNMSWRADPRLDASDIVYNENDFATNKVRMTSVNFTYNGAFRGSGEGRVI